MKLGQVSAGQGDDYTIECLLNYGYFKNNQILIAVDLSKQKALDADPRAIQQIVFQKRAGQKFLKDQKKQSLEFYKGTAKVL